MAKTEFKTIRRKTRKLLDGPEDYDVDFKVAANNIGAEDLVAFANSPNGGTLLIGVEEYEDDSGMQRGRPVGCRVTDEERLKIINKGQSCRPPIDVEVTVENTSQIPFMRVDILPSDQRPHATSSGSYKIRDNGRKRGLSPDELLAIFVQEQSARFAQRFRQATLELESTLRGEISRVASDLKHQLESVQNASDEISQLEATINRKLQNLFRSAENAEALADDAMAFSDETLGATQEIKEEIDQTRAMVQRLAWKLNAILDHHEIEDPEIAERRDKLRFWAEQMARTLARRQKKEGQEPADAEDIREKVIDQMSLRWNVLPPPEESITLGDIKSWVEGPLPFSFSDDDTAEEA